ncbi:hypothetical protein A8C56_08580 [Niabella ginsenosidivorans]|uniref:Uncharacterized protein n=1 Tax=Niabella ginsenosidivorans TaxID=1176587 RepID=A0A1A9I079_9BACT|nr:hypothetical protein A8C56_08580 [Niabella ginsenosidivorans]
MINFLYKTSLYLLSIKKATFLIPVICRSDQQPEASPFFPVAATCFRNRILIKNNKFLSVVFIFYLHLQPC